MKNILKDASKRLMIPLHQLTLFLLLYQYNDLFPDYYAEKTNSNSIKEYALVKAKLNSTSYIPQKSHTPDECKLQIPMLDTTFLMFLNFAEDLHFTNNKLFTLMLTRSLPTLDKIIQFYAQLKDITLVKNPANWIIPPKIESVLNTFGMDYKSFSKFASAIVLYNLFSNVGSKDLDFAFAVYSGLGTTRRN